MRYLVKCTKGSEIKFISHLDFLRTLQRIIRRANINPEFSKGFNPHILLYIAQPLAVGMYSNSEYFDISLKEDMNENEIKDALNQNSIRGIDIIDVVKIKQKKGTKKISLMSLVKAAKYVMRITYKDTNKLKQEMENMMAKEEWNIAKKTKKGEKKVNIKNMIKKISYKIDENYLYIKTIVSCGSSENLSPQLLSEFIQNNTSNSDREKFVYIKREELYTEKDKKLISLEKYYRQN